MNASDFLKAEDVSKYLGIGKNAVYQLAKSGELPSYRIGRKVLFTREDADTFLAGTHVASSDSEQNAPTRFETPQPSNPAEEPDAALAESASFGITPGNPIVIAGNDISADIIAHALNETGIAAIRLNCESYTALVNLYANKASAAVIDLYDQSTNSYNIPYVRHLAPGVSVKVVRLYARSQGLIVRRGNPKKLSSWGALLREGVRLANRTKGSGARILLNEKLRSMEARSETIEGYDARPLTSASAIKHVARGLADVTVGTAREALEDRGVQFVPLQTQWVDIVMRKKPESLPVIRAVEELLANDRTSADLRIISPEGSSMLGCVIFES